jgi:hypothetical protein
VSVVKAQARLTINETVLGEGRAYIHLREPIERAQSAQGTLALDWWDETTDLDDARLALAEGPTLKLDLESDRLSGCIQGRVLRYRTQWPGAPTR